MTTHREKLLIDAIDKLTRILVDQAGWNRSPDPVERSVELAANAGPLGPMNSCRAMWSADRTELCGLFQNHTGSHISWPGSFHFGDAETVDPDADEWETCDVSALTCMYHDPERPGDCPRTPHDHPVCELPRGHKGLHEWQAEDDQRPVNDPYKVPPEVYRIPLPPPVGRSLTDVHGVRWTVGKDVTVHATDPGADLLVPSTLPWPTFLALRGPAELAELTPDELAGEKLYGPVGMRWADPDGPPCPYVEHHHTRPSLDRGCTLRTGHGGPHIGADGLVLGADSVVTGPIAVTPQMAAETLCTCGRPDQHQPGCPRYARMAHTVIDTSDGDGNWEDPLIGRDPGYGTFPHGLDEEPF